MFAAGNKEGKWVSIKKVENDYHKLKFNFDWNKQIFLASGLAVEEVAFLNITITT